jgi:hypothetical protein
MAPAVTGESPGRLIGQLKGARPLIVAVRASSYDRLSLETAGRARAGPAPAAETLLAPLAPFSSREAPRWLLAGSPRPPESRCAVSYVLRSRDPRGPWASPSGGRILLFDVDSFRVVGSVEAPSWVDDLTLMSNDRVCGRINFEMWRGRIAAAQHQLYPPRQPGERNWT